MKILIVRFSSIGDIVLTTPVIRCLKTQTHAEVHYLTFLHFSELLDNNPYIDQLITIRKSVHEVIPLLRRNRYDLVVDLHRNLRTSVLKALLLRPYVSFHKLNVRKYLLVNFKWNLLPKKHLVDRYLETVKGLGVVNDDQGLDYFLPPNPHPVIHILPSDFMGNYIAFVIGGRYTTKRYPAGLAADVINALSLPVVLLGGEEDTEFAAEICMNTNLHKPFNACGRLSLHESASVVAQASLVITNDTGLMHIAAAFRKKTISIWGNTVTDFGMYPYLPPLIQQHSRILEAPFVPCRPCSKLGFRKCPKKHFDCMQKIPPEKIVSAANALLAENPYK